MKNNHSILILTALFSGILIVSSCKKTADTTTTVKEEPGLTIISPVEGDTLVGSVHMKFTATDNKALHTCSIVLGGASTYYADYIEPVEGKTTFSFDSSQNALPTLLEAATFTVSVGDHDSHITTKTVHIHIKQ